MVSRIAILVTIITLLRGAAHKLKCMNATYKQLMGDVLAERRRAAKINKRQLSMMIGLSRLTIRKIEAGDTNPSIDVLLRITQGIGVPLSEVLRDCEQRMQTLPPESLDEPYVLPTA